MINRIRPLGQLTNGHSQQVQPMKIRHQVRGFIKHHETFHAIFRLFSPEIIQYRALYDYTPERSDEIAMSNGDIIIVNNLIYADDCSFSVVFVRWIQQNSKMIIGCLVESVMIDKDSFHQRMLNELRM